MIRKQSFSVTFTSEAAKESAKSSGNEQSFTVSFKNGEITPETEDSLKNTKQNFHQHRCDFHNLKCESINPFDKVFFSNLLQLKQIDYYFSPNLNFTANLIKKIEGGDKK